MSNNRNDRINNNITDEASARAEKIKAIRNAIHDKESADEAYVKKKPTAATVKKKGKKSGKKKKKKTLGQTLRGLFPEKGDSVLEVIRKFVFLCSITAIIVCGYMVGDYYLDLWKSRMQYNEIADIYNIYDPSSDSSNNVDEDEPEEEKYYELLTGAKKLLDINPDVIGYMRIPTKDGDPIVDLPVVQASDNDKYLHLSFKGEESRAGSLFLDHRNHFDVVSDHRLVEKNSENLVVYGHNMADESMFGNLKYYHRNSDYYENHPIIQFNSNYETYTYKIFAFFILDAFDETETKYDCWNNLNFNSEEDFYNFVNEAKRRTIRTNDVDVKYGDPLLTLSTCNSYFEDRGRLVIMARRMRPGEDLYEGTQNSEANPNIKWPTMYYNTYPNEKYDPDNFVPYGPNAKKSDKKSSDKKKETKSEEKNKKSDTERSGG